jgi:hypothetical protein
MKATSAASRRAAPSILALSLALALAIPQDLAAQAGAEAPAGPTYSLSVDAAAGMTLAAAGFDLASPYSAAVWLVQANFLHRIEAPGWGMVLSHQLDISGQAATQASPAFVPSMTVYEAYGRLDLGDSGQFFVGKRRMGLGIGTTFSPGDLVDPRSGFWDQKTGFRGLGLTASLGPDVALRAAMSLDRSFDAYAAGLQSKSAAQAGVGSLPLTGPYIAAQKAAAAYAAALDGAAGPADPRLIVWGISAEAQLEALQVAAAGVFAGGSAKAATRPSLGLSYDLDGVILQAEGAVELSGGPDWFGTAGIRYTFSGDSSSLTASLDYDYNGKPGLLRGTHYLLPYLSYGLTEVFAIYARSLVGIEGPSALLSAGLTLYPVQGFDLELTGLFCLGGAGEEFSSLPAPPSPGAEAPANAVGLAARVHF